MDLGTKTSPRIPTTTRRPRMLDERRSRTGDARHQLEVVIELVILKGSSSSNWPQLTRTNYHEWSLCMKLKMEAQHLRDVVEFDDVEYDDDRSALV